MIKQKAIVLSGVVIDIHDIFYGRLNAALILKEQRGSLVLTCKG